jgi:hypothetical protein
MDPREKATAAALADRSRFRSYQKRVATLAVQMDAPFTVDTPNGVMDGQAGDYLCLDTKGDPYPCAKDVFEASYVEAAIVTVPADERRPAGWN